MNAVNKGKLKRLDQGVVDQVYECLDCRACEAVCPSGVEYGKLVEAARSQIETAREPDYALVKRLVRLVTLQGLFAHKPLFYAFAALLVAYQRSGLQWLARHSGLLKLLRLSEMESMLPPVEWPFVKTGQERWQAAGKERHRVNLFAGCIMSTAFAEVDRATGRVLARNGITVDTPAGQWCCGALHIHSGDEEGAKRLARQNIAAFEKSGAEFTIVLVRAPRKTKSCGKLAGPFRPRWPACGLTSWVKIFRCRAAPCPRLYGKSVKYPGVTTCQSRPSATPGTATCTQIFYATGATLLKWSGCAGPPPKSFGWQSGWAALYQANTVSGCLKKSLWKKLLGRNNLLLCGECASISTRTASLTPASFSRPARVAGKKRGPGRYLFLAIQTTVLKGSLRPLYGPRRCWPVQARRISGRVCAG